ncbi:MAG: DHHW family protein [Candidatus Limivivens sp.]|nr:DHHW family protein [Candidatus Limivivens sp.]
MKKVQNWFVILLFLGTVFGFAGLTVFWEKREFSDRENRALAQLPKANLGDLLDGDFEQDYETYLSDQFPGRDAWIGLKTDVELLMGKQEVNGVYFGADGYLIETHEGIYDTEQARGNLSLLQSFTRKYREIFPDNRMTVMVVPNAVEILDCYLPFYAPDSGGEAYLEQIQSMVPEGTWFDAGAVLERHPGEQLYYRTDHHWTTYGAYCVYEAWAKEKGLSPLGLSGYEREILTTEFEGTIASKVGTEVEADSIERFMPKEEEAENYSLAVNRGQESRESLYQMEKLQTRDKYAVFYGGNQALIQASTEKKNGRRLLVIKDSYANCFVPFTYHDFSQVDMVDIRYFNESLESLIEEGDYTDLLFLYNVSGFAQDVSLQKLLQ